MPSKQLNQNHSRRVERASRAKETINKVIPDILRSTPRARNCIERAERIDEPAAMPSPSATLGTHIKIRLVYQDVLTAAKEVTSTQQRRSTQRNVAILNFASPLRPGGGFLEGANSQEEFLCARTTLYPSLQDRFYRLPEVGGLYTSDVLVFRDSTPEADNLRNDRYYIDVISAGMIRFPDVNEGVSNCSCGISYCDRDRELVLNKMKAVLRIAESKGNKKLVLGAWGCGAYRNPVSEVAKLWRKVIAGNAQQRKPNTESWKHIEEIVFAIPDRGMYAVFEKMFSDILAPESLQQAETEQPEAQDDPLDELNSKIAALEAQLDNAANARMKERLRETLAVLKRELARSLASKAAQDEDLTLREDEEIDGFVVSGYPSSTLTDDNNHFNFDEDDIASDSSDGEHSEIYEFRNRAEAEEADMVSSKLISPDGWYQGSMDELMRLVRQNSGSKCSPGSPGSPGSIGSVSPGTELGGPGLSEEDIMRHRIAHGDLEALSELASVE